MTLQEHRIQQECFEWHWNNYPHQRGLLCYNNNNSTSSVDGAKNKRLGIIPGRSDMVFYLRREAYMIEIKTPDGSQGKDQKAWQELINANGFTYFIIRSLGEFQNLMETINNLSEQKQRRIDAINEPVTCDTCGHDLSVTPAVTVCLTCGEVVE